MLMVDTGAPHSILDRAQLQRLNISVNSLAPANIAAIRGVSTSRIDVLGTATLDFVFGHQTERVSFLVADFDALEYPLLGGGFLTSLGISMQGESLQLGTVAFRKDDDHIFRPDTLLSSAMTSRHGRS